MRLLNVCTALSGALALIMLVIAAHAVQHDSEAVEHIHLAAFIQLASAAAVLAIANRSGRLNLIAGAMILGGAALFAAVLYILALAHDRSLVMLAPVGGITMIVGWFALAFTKPRD